MSNLETIRLGDLLTEQPAYGANASALQPNGIDPRYLRITDIDDQGRLLHCEIRCIPSLVARNYILQDGDIVIARTGNTVGKSYLHKSQNGLLAFAGYLIRFRIDKAKGDPFFVFHFLHSSIYWTWIQNTLRTGAQPNINSLEYKNLAIPKLPLPQQRKIAKILTTVDNLIEKTESLIAKYHSIKQGMMHDLFTRGVDANGKLRPPQSEGMSEELAGTIPVGWQQKALSSLFNVSSGEGLSQAKMCAGQYPVYGGNGITGFHDRYLYQEKRLIIGRVGEYCGNVYITQPQSWITDNALIATFFEKSAYMPFWFYILNQLKLNDFAFAAAQPVITGGILKRIKILLPPLPQQRKIAEILSKQDQLIEDHEKELMKYKQLKTALMQDLLTGEVQVTPDEIDKELAHA